MIFLPVDNLTSIFIPFYLFQKTSSMNMGLIQHFRHIDCFPIKKKVGNSFKSYFFLKILKLVTWINKLTSYFLPFFNKIAIVFKTYMIILYGKNKIRCYFAKTDRKTQYNWRNVPWFFRPTLTSKFLPFPLEKVYLFYKVK